MLKLAKVHEKLELFVFVTGINFLEPSSPSQSLSIAISNKPKQLYNKLKLNAYAKTQTSNRLPTIFNHSLHSK